MIHIHIVFCYGFAYISPQENYVKDSVDLSEELCHKCISETWPMFGRQLRKSAPVVACRWDHGDSHDRGDHHDHHGDDHDMY